MAQEQKGTSMETERPSDNMRQSFFAQLRSICRNIESGLDSLRQDRDIKRDISYEDSVSARNLILHTTRELKELKSQAHTQYKDFIVQSAQLSHTQELMEGIIQVYKERLNNVECFIEKYGYKRPEPLLPEKAKSSESQEDNPEDEVEGSQNDSDSVTDEAKTPPKKPDEDKVRQKNLLSTPKFEDFCSGVPEATLILLDQNRSNIKNSMKAENSNVETSHSQRSALRTPEPPKLLSVSFQKGNTNSNTLNNDSTFGNNCVDTRTPETPEHIRTIIWSSKKSNSKPDTTLGGSSGHYGTPETPEHIKTIMTSMKKSKPDIAHAGQDGQSNDDIFTMALPTFDPFKPKLSTPETPEGVKRLLLSMEKAVPVHERSFPEQPPEVTSNLLSSPEPPECVTLILNSAKKGKLFPRESSNQDWTCTSELSSCEPVQQEMMSKVPYTAKSLYLSTPETPECVKRFVESTRQIEDSQPKLAPTSQAAPSNNKDSDSHKTFSSLSNPHQKPFACTANSLDALVTDANTQPSEIHQKSKGIARLKSAKSLFTSPHSDPTNFNERTTADVRLGVATAYRGYQGKENVFMNSDREEEVNASQPMKRKQTNQMSVLETPEQPAFLKQHINW